MRTLAHDERLLLGRLCAANLAAALVHIAETIELLRHLQHAETERL
jgi:hypothetical protein